MQKRFPLARAVWSFAVRARQNWLARHQVPANFALHMVGIPLAVAGVVALAFLPWLWCAASIVLGYFLQWIGHRIEGNDVGEFILVKRLLGLPVVAIAPTRELAKAEPANE
jgi:hypothetical protein